MPLHEDPAELKEYDPSAPADNYEKGKSPKEVAELRQVVNLRNEMLRRWFKYRLRALGRGVRKLTLRSPDDPLEKILRRMAGLDKPPKQPHAVHIFLEANRAAVLSAATTQWKAQQAPNPSTTEAGATGGVEEAASATAEATGVGDASSKPVDASMPDGTKPDATQGGTDPAPIINPKAMDVDNTETTSSKRKKKGPKGPSVNYTTTVARKMLAGLPKEDRERYASMAKEQGDKAKEEFEIAKVAPPSKDPLVVAKISDGVENLLLDVNQGVEKVVPLRIFSLFGGPTHDSNGEMSVVCVTTAKNKAPVPLSFVDWLGPKRIEELRTEYKRWLLTCFSEDDKKAVLLPDGSSISARTAGQGARASAPPHPTKAGSMVELMKGLHSLDDDDSESDDSDSDGDDDSEEGDDSEDEEEVTTKKGKGKAKPPAPAKSVPTKNATKAKKTAPAPVLSQYEVDRNANIERNRRLLAALTHMQANNVTLPEMEKTGEMGEKARKELDDYATQHNIDANAALPPTLFGDKPKATKRKHGDKVGDGGKENKRPKVAVEPKMTRQKKKDAKEKEARDKEGEREKAQKEREAALEREAAREREAAMQANNAMEANTANEANTTMVKPRPKPIPTAQLKAIAQDKDKGMDEMDSGETINGMTIPGGGDGDVEMTEANADEGLRRVKERLPTLPEWLRGSLDEFVGASGAEKLAAMFLALITLENKYIADGVKAKKGGLPGAKLRPALVGLWLSYGRHTRGHERWVIESASASKFVADWDAWWASLQPAWRTKDETGRWERVSYGEDWGLLYHPGVNGLLSVAATLSWWGSYCVDSGGDEGKWQEAITDVIWVIEGLIKGM